MRRADVRSDDAPRDRRTDAGKGAEDRMIYGRLYNKALHTLLGMQARTANLQAEPEPVRWTLAQVQDDALTALRKACTVRRKHLLLRRWGMDDAANNEKDLQRTQRPRGSVAFATD